MKRALLGAYAIALLSAIPLFAQETNKAPGVNVQVGTTTMKKVDGVRAPPKLTGVRGDLAVALTDSECTTLGGSSVSESACTSGKACETRSENGTWHRVCLSKAE